ncbi:phage antirepressor [Streptobacillus moniliformis]|uniref:phage antirepressor n=1 Tax=Streptobacillus moniliformis TaxID=34105 RepID=UPI0007E2DDFD|nr:phage antirepressor KilAC domain-containing protein [Streptobacillus moniliformis]
MEIITIKNVNGYIKDNIAYLKLEDVARGLGFTTVATSGNEVVRWSRVNKYLEELKFDTSAENENVKLKDSFIPENIFYKLCMKANNDVARKFQDLVCDEILPSIRKHGAYMTNDTLEKALTSPDFLIQLATNLKIEQEKNRRLQGEIEIKNQLIGELKPSKDYLDCILASEDTLKVTQIATDYGLTAQALNKILNEKRVIRKVNKQWILYDEHNRKGYTKSNTIIIPRKNKKDKIITETSWTQKGRLFIHNILESLGYKANRDKEVI